MSFSQVLRFERFYLGSIPFKITSIKGVSTSSGKDNAFRMDIDFVWIGNPDILMEIGVIGLPFVALRLENLTMSMTMRLEFRDFNSNAIPGFDAVSICFLSRPVIDFTLTVGRGAFAVDITSLGLGYYDSSAGMPAIKISIFP